MSNSQGLLTKALNPQTTWRAPQILKEQLNWGVPKQATSETNVKQGMYIHQPTPSIEIRCKCTLG